MYFFFCLFLFRKLIDSLFRVLVHAIKSQMIEINDPYSIERRFQIGALLFFPEIAVRITNQVRFTGGGDETLSKAEMVNMFQL